MYNFLNEAFERLISNVSLSTKRYLYKTFHLSRLTALIGPRGVGKSTLMLQFIKENLLHTNKVFYFSADTVYFQQSTLLSFINDLYKLEGYRIFFIDEIHKYTNWNQEIKNLYDAFPDIKIIYSGSSQLELIQGGYDLSRRVDAYHLAGLSFREYLNFLTPGSHEAIEYNSLIHSPKNYNILGMTDKVLNYFKNYLEAGYYPFFFDGPEHYQSRVLRIIDKIIYEDIPHYFDLKTHNLHVFKKILGYLANIPPGEVNTNNIAKNLHIAHQTIFNYLTILERIGLIQMLYTNEPGTAQLRKPQKIILHNTTLLNALTYASGNDQLKGSERELFFVQSLRDAGQSVYYSKQGDYAVSENIFEIGGKNKTRKQLKDIPQSGIIVKDDSLIASQQNIPLFYFGFLY